jgi:L-amino acid N-acyltransferase YncA
MSTYAPHALASTSPTQSAHVSRHSLSTRLCRARAAPFQGRQDSFDIRPIRPTDAELIVAALAYTSDETYYRRFRAVKRYFSPEELEYLTEVDGTTHVALVAIEHGDHPRLAAVARFCTDPANPLEAELAICVHDPFRRQGLSAEMLRQLHDEASSRGVKQLRAMVQSDNVAMLELLYHAFPATRVDRCYDGEADYLIPVQPAVAVASAAEHRNRTPPPGLPGPPNTRILDQRAAISGETQQLGAARLTAGHRQTASDVRPMPGNRAHTAALLNIPSQSRTRSREQQRQRDHNHLPALLRRGQTRVPGTLIKRRHG